MQIRNGKIRIQDGKNSDPGSAINITDPQHCSGIIQISLFPACSQVYGSKAETDEGPGQGQAKKDASHRKAHDFSHSA